MDIFALFSNKKKEETERECLDRKFGSQPKRIELFTEGNALPQGEGNWIPQIEHGQEWDARMGRWVE